MLKLTRYLHIFTILGLLFILSACQLVVPDPAELESSQQAAAQREANKAIIARFYDEIWNQGDMAVIDEIIAEDFTDRFSGQNGREAFKQTVNLFRTAYPDLEVTYEDMVAEDDVVVVLIHSKGTYQGGMKEIFGIPDSVIGTEAVMVGVDYARIENGMIVEGWGSHDELGRFLQLGYTLEPPQDE